MRVKRRLRESDWRRKPKKREYVNTTKLNKSIFV
jgi:hypothetical protein